MSDVLWQTLDYLIQGGWVMIPLGITSVAMWTLIIERLRTYRTLERRDMRIDEALAALDGKLVKRRVIERGGLRATLLRDFLDEMTGDLHADAALLQRCRLHQEAELRRFLAMIAVLAGVAPLLGLLGTVIGMIQTFDVISIFGTGNAKAMAGGISVAMITTEAGLLVAIPGLFLSGLLGRRARRLKTRLDEISTVLARHIRQSGAPLRAAKGV
jgi:biopolymer transport protein ExbB